MWINWQNSAVLNLTKLNHYGWCKKMFLESRRSKFLISQLREMTLLDCQYFHPICHNVASFAPSLEKKLHTNQTPFPSHRQKLATLLSIANSLKENPRLPSDLLFNSTECRPNLCHLSAWNLWSPSIMLYETFNWKYQVFENRFCNHSVTFSLHPNLHRARLYYSRQMEVMLSTLLEFEFKSSVLILSELTANFLRRESTLCRLQ